MKNISFFILIHFICIGTLTWAQEPDRLRRDQSFIGIHFDFHAGKDDNEIGKNTTPEMVQSIIDLVQPDYIQTDCKGHRGYSSYPTSVGNSTSGIVDDPLRIWRDVTKKNGVSLYMHYSGVWDTRAIELNPEWAVINADGFRDKDKTSVFGNYVDQLLIPQLKELAGDYDIDGVWVDGECWATIPDYNDKAQRLFKEKSKIDKIPKSSNDANWYEWMQFHREGFRKYLRHYVSAVRSEYPDFQICSNWAFTHHMSEPVSVAMDFLSGDYSPNNSVNSARYAGRYLVHQGLPWDLMAWSFSYEPHPREQKPAIQLKREAAIVLALGGGFQAYFTQNRDGSVRLEELAVMEEVAKFARARQAWCHRSVQIPQVALLISTNDYQINSNSLFPQYKGNAQGVLECLLDNQYSVDLLSEGSLSPDMSRFPVIVIPEWEDISPVFRDDLIEYAKEGGKLLIIGEKTSLQFSELIDVHLGNKKFVLESIEKGAIGFIPYGIGSKYGEKNSYSLRTELGEVMEVMFPDPIVEIKGSHNIDVSTSKLDGKLTIHLVNTSGDHKNAGIINEIDPIHNLKINIRCEAKPSKISLQPYGEKVDFKYSDGVVKLELDRLDIYDILVVEE